MKELEFIKIINETLSDNSYLGDDCAYLKEFDLFVSHDTLVEDVHFSLSFATPFQIGYKAVVVNISDILSALAIPKYITISLSLPKNTSNEFVKEVYKGVDCACEEYKIKVIGGDITGSDKIVISICALGKKDCNFLAKRNKAKVGDVIVTTGVHGSSKAGLECLFNNIDNEFLKQKHLMTKLSTNSINHLKQVITTDIACMDTSDGLFDAVYKICEQSNVSAKLDFSSIPYDKEIEIFKNFKDFILFGGEDYQIVATISQKDYQKADKKQIFKIGEIIAKENDLVIIDKKGFTKNSIEQTFNHFSHS